MNPTAGLLLALAASLTWLDPTALTPGQRGVCITEWSGGQRREIPVTVLGTMDASAPERTSVLIRLDDPELAGMGVPAGMSGSPVMIDGKLLGAIAFGFAFARDPIAGVTPFATMRGIGEKAASAPAPFRAATVGELAAVAAGRIAPSALVPILAPAPSGRLGRLAVAGLPLGAGGFGQDVLAGAGWDAIPAGTTTDLTGVPAAGDMLAVLLVWGDATIGAGGTVTARDGDTLWAFGHPLFGLGAVRLPVARARVLAIQGSYQNPFKFFSVGAPFGTLIADRPAGVLARAGAVPEGIPVAVRVSDPAGGGSWHFHVADMPLLSPLMVSYLTNACLQARGALAGEAAVIMTVTARLRDAREVAVRFAVRSADAPARAAAFAGGVMAVLGNSPFPHPGVAGVEIDLDRREQLDGATIVEAIPARTTIGEGEMLAVDVRLRPHQGEMQSERVEIRVPTGAAGKVDLIVADGSAFADYRLRSGLVVPVSFADQLTQLAMLESSATLVVVLESRERGVSLPGATFEAVPPSFSATLASGLGSKAVTWLPTTVIAASRRDFGAPLEGAVRIPLTIRPRLEMP